MKRFASCLSILLCGAAKLMAEPVSEILVQGNEKTTTETVKLMAGLERGDDWKNASQATIRAALQRSGLFKSVDVQSESVQSGRQVTLSVSEKKSFIVAPTLFFEPTQKGLGLGALEVNKDGEGERVLVYGQLTTGDSLLFGYYHDPHLFDTLLFSQVDAIAKWSQVREYSAPERLGEPEPVRDSTVRFAGGGATLGLRFGALQVSGRLRAARVKVGISTLPGLYDEYGIGVRTTRPGASGGDVSAIGKIEYDSRTTWYGVTEGSRVGISYERALLDLGSSFDYSLAELRLERQYKFIGKQGILLRGSAGYGQNLPFHQELTLGGPTMRGFKNAHFRGNLRLLAGAEYSVPVILLKGFSLRASAFWDTGYATFTRQRAEDAKRDYVPGTKRTGLAPWKNTVGLGGRVYLQQIALPLLGVDVGYGVERKAWEVYVSVGSTD